MAAAAPAADGALGARAGADAAPRRRGRRRPARLEDQRRRAGDREVDVSSVSSAPSVSADGRAPGEGRMSADGRAPADSRVPADVLAALPPSAAPLTLIAADGTRRDAGGVLTLPPAQVLLEL